MMDFSKLKAGDVIEYIGNSFTFGGKYTIITTESTYLDEDSCPEDEKGKLLVIEFTNNGEPLFYSIETLNPKEWVLVENEEW